MRCVFIPLIMAAGAGCTSSYAPSETLALSPETGTQLEGGTGGVEAPQPAGNPLPAPPPADAISTARPAAEAGPAPGAVAREIIYAARLKIVVHSAESAFVEARRTAEEAGGYLQEQTRGRAVLRVPAPQFQAVLDRLEGLGSVADREVRAEDVTEQVVDLQSRLRNARAVEARLKELLAKAKDVKEALQVEAELRRLGEEIERMEGRLKLLSHLVAFGTITVEFLGKAPVAEPIAPRVRLPFRWIGSLDLESLIEQASRHALRHPGMIKEGGTR